MSQRQEKSGPAVNPKLIAALVIVALIVVFVVQNTEDTPIRFIIPKVTAPLWVALFVSVLAGAAVGFLLGRSRGRERGRSSR